MTIYRGSGAATAIWCGSTAVTKIYRGSALIWEPDGGGNPQNNSFVTVWRTTAAAETITLPLIAVSGHSYNFVVDWGDGSANDTITSHTDAARVHTYATAGDYTVTITGAMPGWSFNNGGDRLKIRNIANWGQVGFKATGVASAFYGCANMTCTATDTPDMSAVTNMANMFRGATAFNGAIGAWNTANVTNMFAMFHSASAFNGAIGAWNTGSATSISAMFHSATAFNQDIGAWNTANVTNMSDMFRGATAFNQDIGAWNTANVTNIESMFRGATAFNQDIGGWSVAELTAAGNMFLEATLSTTNYDALLVGWAAQTVKPSVAFHGGGSKYTTTGQAARNTLTGAPNNWTITDGGLQA